ncbi:MAG: hypothetical protein GC151_14050 [Betaproteobacteria bacterium]|nr:hypothetical protein [Betaproteobacteria bacterium]
MNAIRALLIVASVFSACPSGAWADDLAKGQDIVKARCVMCHNHDRLVQMAGRLPPEKRMARWETFLPGHNLPDAEDRRCVMTYLKEATSK